MNFWIGSKPVFYNICIHKNKAGLLKTCFMKGKHKKHLFFSTINHRLVFTKTCNFKFGTAIHLMFFVTTLHTIRTLINQNGFSIPFCCNSFFIYAIINNIQNSRFGSFLRKDLIVSIRSS